MIASPGMPREHGTTRNESQMVTLDTSGPGGVQPAKIYMDLTLETAFDG